MSDNQEYDDGNHENNQSQQQNGNNGNEQTQDQQNYDEDVSWWISDVIIELRRDLGRQIAIIEKWKNHFECVSANRHVGMIRLTREREALSFRFEPSRE